MILQLIMRFNNIKECIEYSRTHDMIDEHIDLSCNNITEISENWKPQCKTISLNDNNITRIPEKWKPQCTDIFLDNNQITKIPEK